MKIDIEGSDRCCLEALRHVVDRPDFLSIESERAHASEAQAELDQLESLGYRGLQVVQQSRVPGMRRILWAIEKYTGLPFPGWYDTHARLAQA